MVYWNAHYKDAMHDVDIKILNTEEDSRTNPLQFELDGIKFEGREPGCFRLAEKCQYEEAKEKFCILKLGGNSIGGRKMPYYYELQRYALDLEIPVCMIRKKDSSEVRGMLHLAFEYVEQDENHGQIRWMCDEVEVIRDDVIVSDISLHVEDKSYHSSKKSLYFNKILGDFSVNIKAEYFLKSCYTCQYSEYSPYGEDYYGTMLCYRNYKQECLKVHNKDDYFDYLETKNCDVRQETYVCGEYETRNKSCGYRGFVEGVK